MKWLLGFLLLFTACDVFAFELQPDKRMHLEVSACMGFVSYSLLRAMKKPKKKAILYSFLFVMTMGVVKEAFLDDKFDMEDVKYNAIGSSVGIMAPFVIGF